MLRRAFAAGHSRGESADIVIIGGGVIGLVVAWRLAKRGTSVTVLDDGKPGQASAAAAGMLAPLAEAHAPGPLTSLGLSSLRYYPEFIAELASETDSPLTLCGPGLLRTAQSEEEEEHLCTAVAWQKHCGLPLERLDSAAFHALEPNISSTVRSAVLSSNEQHIPPRLLHAALEEACIRRNVTFLSEAALGFDTTTSTVHGVQTAFGAISCGSVLIAGGAWSVGLCEKLNIMCPVYPVCGQIIALTPSEPLLIHHTVYTQHGYLVPRPDGTVVAGATEEHVGYNARTTADGINGLQTMARGLVPLLNGAPLYSAWAGLRPVSRDMLPLLGRAPGWENVHLATGHGRNGILLTPITGMLLAEHMLGGAMPPAAFDPARFGTSA